MDVAALAMARVTVHVQAVVILPVLASAILVVWVIANIVVQAMKPKALAMRTGNIHL